MVLLKPIIHAMESEGRPSKRQSQLSGSSNQEAATIALPSSPSVREAFVPSEASKSHPDDVAPTSVLSEFEDFPLKHVSSIGQPPPSAPFGTASSFSSRAQAVFGSLGASLGSSRAEGSLTDPEFARASLASGDQEAVSQEVLSESLGSKDQVNSWYVSGTVEQRRRKALKDDIPSGITIEEVEVGDGTSGTTSAGGGSRGNPERALALGSSGEVGMELADDEEDEEELQRHGWRRRAAGSREGGSFLGDTSMMSQKAEAAQVAGMVGQDDTLDGEEEEDEFDIIAEGMVPGNSDDAILHVSKSSWAENFSEEIGQVKKIMGRIGDGGSTERWRQGWRPEDRAKVDREGATLRLLEDNEDMKQTASRQADRALTGNGEHADVEMTELDSAPKSGPDRQGASACPQDSDDLASKLAVQGKSEGKSNLDMFLEDLGDGLDSASRGCRGAHKEGGGPSSVTLEAEEKVEPAATGTPGNLFSWPSRLSQPFLSKPRIPEEATQKVTPSTGSASGTEGSLGTDRAATVAGVGAHSELLSLEAVQGEATLSVARADGSGQTGGESCAEARPESSRAGECGLKESDGSLPAECSKLGEQDGAGEGVEGVMRRLPSRGILKKRERKAGDEDSCGDYVRAPRRSGKRVRFDVQDCPEGLEDKVSHLPPPQRPTSQKASVPDHVQNPKKYTCYTLDWSDMDQRGGATGSSSSNSDAADMAAYRSALYDALSVAAASRREARSAEAGGVGKKEKEKGKGKEMDVGLLGSALPQVVPGSLGGGGDTEPAVENRVLFVKRSKRIAEQPAPDAAGTVDKDTAQVKKAGGHAQGAGRAAAPASAFGMAAALMAEEDDEDAGDGLV